MARALVEALELPGALYPRDHKVTEGSSFVPSPGYSTPKGAEEALAEVVVLEQAERWIDAARVLTSIERKADVRALVLLKRAMCMSKLGFHGEAIHDLNTAEYEFPQDARPAFYRALIYIQWGKEEDAFKYLTKVA